MWQTKWNQIYLMSSLTFLCSCPGVFDLAHLLRPTIHVCLFTINTVKKLYMTYNPQFSNLRISIIAICGSFTFLWNWNIWSDLHIFGDCDNIQYMLGFTTRDKVESLWGQRQSLHCKRSQKRQGWAQAAWAARYWGGWAQAAPGKAAVNIDADVPNHSLASYCLSIAGADYFWAGDDD